MGHLLPSPASLFPPSRGCGGLWSGPQDAQINPGDCCPLPTSGEGPGDQPLTAKSQGVGKEALSPALPERYQEGEMWFNETKGGKLTESQEDPPTPESITSKDDPVDESLKGHLGRHRPKTEATRE